MTDLPSGFLEFLKTIKGKRSRVVIEHILQHGFITTEDLEKIYGYNHPPRAVRDVREQGVPIETFSVKNSEGRTIAAYRFGSFQARRMTGRHTFSKAFKNQLLARHGERCSICAIIYGNLQIDHRVPYEIGGDVHSDERELQDYMLLCGSCNRAKSWACEHCQNWLVDKNPKICQSCYWASPQAYTHIAKHAVHRLDIVWTENETAVYERLKRQADAQGKSLADYIKHILESDWGNRPLLRIPALPATLHNGLLLKAKAHHDGCFHLLFAER
jgi:hypothetical protein